MEWTTVSPRMEFCGPVVELAYTSDLKSDARTGLRVRVSPGPLKHCIRSKIMDNIHHFESDKLFTRIIVGLAIGVVIFVAFGL